QKDNCQRQLPPPDWEPARSGHNANDEPIRPFVAATNDARDRAQADNLDWIVKREGANGKVLIFASRYHLSAMPINDPLGLRGDCATPPWRALNASIGTRAFPLQLGHRTAHTLLARRN